MSGYYEFFTEEDNDCNISLEEVGYKECDKSTHSYEDLRNKYIAKIKQAYDNTTDNEVKNCIAAKIEQSLEDSDKEINREIATLSNFLENYDELKEKKHNSVFLNTKKEQSNSNVYRENVKLYLYIIIVFVLLVIQLILILM